MQLLCYFNTGISFCFNVFGVFNLDLTNTSICCSFEVVVISYAMGTSDNTYVSKLKYCHYLMYLFCVSLFLPHELLPFSFSCLGHDRLRPNEMNLCSKPRTSCCTPRRNRYETVRQNIFIFLRGRSFSIFNLECAPLF